ncbi:MAG TPA: amidohydrolase family protein [Steroidobacteraceae bacterium]|nr:amidohydrolase family protein [Steroidobacteraceae bacterium]
MNGSGSGLDIVDAQVHIGPDRIEQTLAAMDALGIRAILVDEYWIGRATGDPGYRIPGGAFRPVQPTAELAALMHPERFSYLVRLDRRDEDAAAIIRLARDAPHARALRITPGMWSAESEAFAAGAYEPICAAACDCGLPLFIFAPGRARDVVQYARKFPPLRIVIDHCGLLSNSMRRKIGGGAPLSRDAQLEAFEQVLALADLPNVALKWAHAPAMFDAPGYPGQGLWPVLRMALERFGADRIMWASDVGANQTGESWAMLLFGVLGDPDLSEAERKALLGGTARAWLDWAA